MDLTSSSKYIHTYLSYLVLSITISFFGIIIQIVVQIPCKLASKAPQVLAKATAEGEELGCLDCRL